MHPRSSHLLLLGITPLFALPVWAAGGTYRPWQGLFLPACAFAILCFFLPPASEAFPSRRERLHRLLRDPCVFSALFFLAYLCLQWRNSPRIRLFDFDRGWVLSPPPHPAWPSSISPSESVEMLHWFAPVLTAFLFLRHTATALPKRPLLLLVVLNGLLNAALSFHHLRTGWKLMYGFQRFGDDVYGTFGYPNHGAIYFILLTALALGLCLRELFREAAERSRSLLFFSALASLVFFLAATFSTSRAGILGAWITVGLTFLGIALLAWPRLHPAQRLLGGLSALLFLALLAAAFQLFAQPVHLRELAAATTRLDVGREIQSRWFQIDSAWRMWLDHPFYGVGGWGYRYLAADYLPREQWPLLQGFGRANVHNDLMQFLCEFGLVGLSLFASVFAPLLVRVVRGAFRPPTEDDSLWASPLRIASLAGLTVLLLVAQFDIPLRSPAVFLHAVLLLFLLLPDENDPSLWLPVIDWTLLQPAALRVVPHSPHSTAGLDAEEFP